MEFTHCIHIEMKLKLGVSGDIDFPYDNLEDLKKVAEAAWKIPYVGKYYIWKRDSTLESSSSDDDTPTKPHWNSKCPIARRYKEQGLIKPNPEGEGKFRQDLRKRLKNSSLLRRLYRARAKFERAFSEEVEFSDDEDEKMAAWGGTTIELSER